MPELPEVEVVRLGIDPFVTGQIVQDVVIRRPQLRWPIPQDLNVILSQQKVLSTARRSKYLILEFTRGWLLIHLGMSGVLQWQSFDQPLKVHDHVDWLFTHGRLRLNDPRRFGAVLWHPRNNGSLEEHPLLARLGVEPFDMRFTGEHMFALSRGKTIAIKQALLAGSLVVGVGNIYASECLFRAQIDPRRAAGSIARKRYDKLALAIRDILSNAIEKGGSTLRDFRGASGDSGYFQINHQVYGKTGQPCPVCSAPIQMLVQGQRSSFFCRKCQH